MQLEAHFAVFYELLQSSEAPTLLVGGQEEEWSEKISPLP